VRGEGGGDEGERGGGHDTANSSGVKIRQVVSHVSRRLSTEQARDHETADDEEHVDADVTTFESRHAGVRENHQDDGNGAKTLDVRSKRWRAVRSPVTAPVSTRSILGSSSTDTSSTLHRRQLRFGRRETLGGFNT